MREYTVSTRISGELAEQVDKLSAALGRNKAWVLHHALESYVSSEQQFIEAVREGMAAYQAGRVVDHTEVVADWEQRRKSPPS